MTNEPSPRPWSLFVHDEQEGGDGEVSICAEGEWIATMNLRRSSAKDDARLICDAVNEREHLRAQLAATVSEALAIREERDRLRDLVRRLLPLAETTVENIRALGTARFPFEEHIKSDRLRGDIQREVSSADHLLREARAALGAGETPTGKGVGV